MESERLEIRKMRTLKQIIKEIKEDDPKSCITKYMLYSIIQSNNIYNIYVGNKHLYDLNEVAKALGILYE